MKTLIDYVGVPYQPRGVFPAGADCYSLVKAYAKNVLAQDWPDYMYDVESYMRQAQTHILSEMAVLGERWKQVAKPMDGDLLIFRMSGHPTHCAVYVGGGNMLHTLRGRQSCIERVDGWLDCMVGIYRWVG